MKAHIFQHVPFEDTGSIGNWLKGRKAEVTYTQFFSDPYPPENHDMDLLIILGGPMSVNDEDAFPWLRAEKSFIQDSVHHGIPTLGICLGAQLIAGALGARIYKNPQKEIGWFNVRAVPSTGDCYQFPKEFVAFHWHGEAFELPQGAVQLARSKACENQAFQIGRHVVGLQFHLESTPESIRALAENCRNELIPGTFIQTEKQLRQVAPSRYGEINSIMNDLLSYLTGGLP